MDQVTSVHLAHVPPDIITHILLVRNLKNAPFLLEQLVAGNTDYEYALLDATTVLSTTHLLAAIFRALNDMRANRIKSRNIHSEIVFSLSPNNNIAESFRKFGVSDKTTDLIVVKSGSLCDISAEQVVQHVQDAFEGNLAPFTDQNLFSISDIDKIRKIYRLPLTRSTMLSEAQNGATDSNALLELHKRHETEIVILGIMALRGAS